jgi:hypothetical protein
MPQPRRKQRARQLHLWQAHVRRMTPPRVQCRMAALLLVIAGLPGIGIGGADPAFLAGC